MGVVVSPNGRGCRHVVITDDVTGSELSAIGYGLSSGDLDAVRGVIIAAGLEPAHYRLFH